MTIKELEIRLAIVAAALAKDPGAELTAAEKTAMLEVAGEVVLDLKRIADAVTSIDRHGRQQ